ncbi:MAG: diheme cytochrome c [Candidatus Competibacter sp.]|nr:diheme cytochrome c [Candidatus Competibacter sp.]MDG4606163.1 diheme cytochrome c [Candidatus Contendobacter sp.]HUN10601.1 diheme cytochrome c [Aggregatilineales bacterium]
MNLPCSIRRWMAAAAGLGALLVPVAGAVYADSSIRPLDHPVWRQECGACHVAYPPQLLPAPSWQAIMSGLDRHFGADARLDSQAQADILRFLELNAGRDETRAGGKPPLRITETRWFIHEHTEELPAGVWKRPDVKSPANCAACHTAADRGDYSERTLHLPKGFSTPSHSKD